MRQSQPSDTFHGRAKMRESREKTNTAGKSNLKEGIVKKERDGWPGENGQAGESATTCQHPGGYSSESCPQFPVLTVGSDWLFKGRVVGQLLSSALVNSASSVDSFAWSIHIKKRTVKNGNNNHTQCCVHPPNALHEIHTASTSPSFGKSW